MLRFSHTLGLSHLQKCLSKKCSPCGSGKLSIKGIISLPISGIRPDPVSGLDPQLPFQPLDHSLILCNSAGDDKFLLDRPDD